MIFIWCNRKIPTSLKVFADFNDGVWFLLCFPICNHLSLRHRHKYCTGCTSSFVKVVFSVYSGFLRQDITEILLKVALNTINQTKPIKINCYSIDVNIIAQSRFTNEAGVLVKRMRGDQVTEEGNTITSSHFVLSIRY